MGIRDILWLRKQDKALKKSTGLEKIRLLMRSSSILVGHLQLKEDIEIVLESTVGMAQMYLADVFYGQLRDLHIRLNSPDACNKLAEDISTSREKNSIIRSRLSGAALGIVLFKATNSSNKKINDAGVKQLINSLTLDDEYKKEFLRITKTCIDFMRDEEFGFATGENATISHELDIIASSALDNKLEKGHYVDPMIKAFMYAAMNVAYRETVILDFSLKQFEDAGLIK